jgi:hypothetical protein
MNPSLFNMYQLAENLHMTVGSMSREMSMSEYMGWIAFYAQKAEDMERESKGIPKRPAGQPGDDVVMTGFGL